MHLFDAAAVLLVLAAFFGFVNHHLFRLPFTIGLLISGLLASLCVIAVDAVVPAWDLAPTVREAVLSIDFADAVLKGMLSLLLFAGALHTDFAQLRERFPTILSLASVGVLISTLLAGLAAYGLFSLVGLEIPFLWCLVFGALISPTDPIAVLGIMKAAKAPKHLEVKVIGESLFNDGVGVVVFTVLVGIAVAFTTGSSEAAEAALAPAGVVGLLAQEVVGGLTLGLAAGYLCYRAMRTLDEPNLEILLSVATVLGLNFLAFNLHLSAPLAAVVAGLFIGNSGRHRAMSDRTRQSLDSVWTFIDEALNAVLFLLIGLEVFAIDYSRAGYLAAAAGILPLVLAARLAAVGLPVAALRLRREIEGGTVRVLTWGGLKGGISVALAMQLPEFPGRNAVLTVTYIVVVFSIVVQGLTVGPLIRRLHPADQPLAAEPPTAPPEAAAGA
jgi:monovalent cation:H+ antiporter, CPA1 family